MKFQVGDFVTLKKPIMEYVYKVIENDNNVFKLERISKTHKGIYFCVKEYLRLASPEEISKTIAEKLL